jgi:hypothetical protein
MAPVELDAGVGWAHALGVQQVQGACFFLSPSAFLPLPLFVFPFVSPRMDAWIGLFISLYTANYL